jgi:hypothetical protein
MDMLDLYNTPLSASEESAFRDWAKTHKRGKDLADYDMRGWWKANAGADPEEGHLTDKYKKPNHPTFSDESIYHGSKMANGTPIEGGHWDEEAGTFAPSKFQRLTQDEDSLDKYFRQNEPDTIVDYSSWND